MMDRPQLNIFKKYLFVVWVFCTAKIGMAQGPWTQEKKTGFIQVQTTLPTLGSYDGLIREGRNVTDTDPINRKVVNADVGIYFLYGITDKLTIISQLPFKYVAAKEETGFLYNPVLLDEGDLFGLSNYHLSVKYRLVDKVVTAAVSLQTNWNTVSKNLEKGLATGYLSNSFGLFGHIGGSLSPRWYSFLDLGYNLSTNDYSDIVNVFFELGFKAIATKELWLVFNFKVRESLENGDFLNENLTQTGLFPNDQEWMGYGFKLYVETSKQIGFTLGTSGALSANYVGLVAPITFGVFRKW